MRVRKRCLACHRVALYERGVTVCTRHYGYGTLGHYCRGPLEIVPRRTARRRDLTAQEVAARLIIQLRRKINRLLRRVSDDSDSLRAAWKLLAKYEARARMTDAQVAEEKARLSAIAAKALETRKSGKGRRAIATGGLT